VKNAALQIKGLACRRSRIVAVGVQADTHGNRGEAAVWLSNDFGHTWTRQHSRAFTGRAGFKQHGQQMTGVTTAPFGFVAVGSDHPSGPVGLAAAVWTSPDGHRWTSISNPSLSGTGIIEMNDVALVDGRIVAGGDVASPSATNKLTAQLTSKNKKVQTAAILALSRGQNGQDAAIWEAPFHRGTSAAAR
jgi:hypothetical protein